MIFASASWTGTLTGSFASVVGVPSGYTVVYNANSITLQKTGGLAPMGFNATAAKPYSGMYGTTHIGAAQKNLLASM